MLQNLPTMEGLVYRSLPYHLNNNRSVRLNLINLDSTTIKSIKKQSSIIGPSAADLINTSQLTINDDVTKNKYNYLSRSMV